MASAARSELGPLLGLAAFALSCLYPVLGAQFVLVDDHEIISYTQPGSGPPLDGLGIMIFSADPAVGRLRPMYWLTRLGEITLLRDNPTAWHALALGIGLASAMLLYATWRTLEFNRWLGWLLGGWLLVAPGVSSTWVRLGPNETVGTLFLAIALLTAAQASRARGRRQVILDIAFLLSASAMFLSKESFSLAAPALALFRVLAGRAAGKMQITWSSASVCAVGIVLAVAAALAGRAAGSESYAGQYLSPPDALTYAERVGHNLGILAFAGVGWVALLFVPVLRRAGRCQQPIGEIVLAALLVLPQALLYSNQGILEGRYELPAAIGIAGLVVGGVAFVQKRAQPKLYRASVALFGATVLAFGISTWTYADYFAADSIQLQNLLRTVTRQAPPNTLIGIAADPARQYEPILSMATYLERFGRDDAHVKLLPLIDADQPYTPAETNLVEAIDSTPVMAAPSLSESGCSNLGALIVLHDESAAKAALPCLDSGFRRDEFSATVLLWGGEAVSLRPRLPGRGRVMYVAYLREP